MVEKLVEAVEKHTMLRLLSSCVYLSIYFRSTFFGRKNSSVFLQKFFLEFLIFFRWSRSQLAFLGSRGSLTHCLVPQNLEITNFGRGGLKISNFGRGSLEIPKFGRDRLIIKPGNNKEMKFWNQINIPPNLFTLRPNQSHFDPVKDLGEGIWSPSLS